MSVGIEILPEAQRMLEAADEHWTDEHGYFAENPLLNELESAADRLRANPEIGVIVRRGRSTIRRLLMQSGWHIYYRFRTERKLVEILAVWFAGRGSGPPL